jgi:NTP pyrophosphatase (non-canonical NTP hydrolase)
MHIREYQTWLEEWDKARTWDKVMLSHTLLHALEELGEVSKLVQMLEGYRPMEPEDETELRDALALELSDLQVMIFKLAYQAGIDMEEAMIRGQRKADERFPDPSTGPAERNAYWRRFQEQVSKVDSGNNQITKPAPHQNKDV